MSKLYVFGIGGTGSRVIKSLTMLMAAGVKINADEVVPIIIDPDLAAADLTRTVKLMQDYVKVRDRIDVNTASNNGFFNTKIGMDIIPSGRIPVENTKDITFREYIGLSLMKDKNGKEDPNFALASMLFSQKNLDSKMDVGFKGNPNIGSVVLNQFSFSEEYKAFANSVKKDDRVFVVSSIFGGTGASGFPLLVKEIRKVNEQFNDSYRIQPWAKDHKIDDTFVRQQYFQSDLTGIKNAYLEWLGEMATNNRAFAPYDLSEKKNDLFALIKGEKPAKVVRHTGRINIVEHNFIKKGAVGRTPL